MVDTLFKSTMTQLSKSNARKSWTPELMSLLSERTYSYVKGKIFLELVSLLSPSFISSALPSPPLDTVADLFFAISAYLSSKLGRHRFISICIMQYPPTQKKKKNTGTSHACQIHNRFQWLTSFKFTWSKSKYYLSNSCTFFWEKILLRPTSINHTDAMAEILESFTGEVVLEKAVAIKKKGISFIWFRFWSVLPFLSPRMSDSWIMVHTLELSMIEREYIDTATLVIKLSLLMRNTGFKSLKGEGTMWALKRILASKSLKNKCIVLFRHKGASRTIVAW